MIRKLLILTAALFAPLLAWTAQKSWPANVIAPAVVPPPPAREFRAAWIATVANIDWPSKPGLPVAQQKAEMLSLLDQAAALKFNAVFFQVRPVSDAFYASDIEPWSEYLTGVQGRAPQPFYDPLAFAITEAHRRGLQLHAWFNPYRAGHPSSKSPPSPDHITRTHPELICHYGTQTVLDPGEPATQARVRAVILDVVRRYDVDGVVLDDYFYPDPEKDFRGRVMDFPDDASWQKYGPASGLSRADWRRDNVNRFIQNLSQSIKAVKPQVQFGVSPFGIWRPKNPPSITGMDAYGQIYADSRKWLASGWVDYLAPQLYWPVASPGQSFPVLFDWWRAQNAAGRHVWPALSDASVPGKFFANEIPLQIQIIRQKNDPGAVHYHLRSVLTNAPLAAAIGRQYQQPALVPLSPWIMAVPPAKPALTATLDANNGVSFWWGNNGAVRWWLFQSYDGSQWTTQIFPAQYAGNDFKNSRPDAVSLRAVDRLGNLSEPAVWTQKNIARPTPAGG